MFDRTLFSKDYDPFAKSPIGSDGKVMWKNQWNSEDDFIDAVKVGIEKEAIFNSNNYEVELGKMKGIGRGARGYALATTKAKRIEFELIIKINLSDLKDIDVSSLGDGGAAPEKEVKIPKKADRKSARRFPKADMLKLQVQALHNEADELTSHIEVEEYSRDYLYVLNIQPRMFEKTINFLKNKYYIVATAGESNGKIYLSKRDKNLDW